MKKVFLSDFDGTITKKDVIESIMENFAPPQWKKIYDDLVNGIIDIDEGIKKMFNLLPSSKKDEIINWVIENIEIREGFDEFLDYLNEVKIPFVVLSGGLDFYMEPLLEKYKDKIYRVYNNKAVFDKEYIDVEFIYQCGNVCERNCGVCKPYIIERDFRDYYRYYAGDGVTDIQAAKFCHKIFATSSLKKYLDKKGLEYISFNNFYDILEAVKQEVSHGV